MPYCVGGRCPPSIKCRLAEAHRLIGLSNKAKREIDEGCIAAVNFTPEADEKNFSFVNESPRRLLSQRVGIEAARRLAVVCANEMCESEGERSVCAYAQTRSGRASRCCWLRSSRQRRGRRYLAG